MRLPKPVYQIESQLSEQLAVLRPAQRLALAWWVYGSILARSACQNAVVSALVAYGRAHTVRAYLREFLLDGGHKRAKCATQVEVPACFAGLLGWVMKLWQGREVPLAIDATTRADQLTCLVVSVLYRGCAIPVAWQVVPGNRKGSWIPLLVGLLQQLVPAVPAERMVVVMADRGLWSPRLYDTLRRWGWHPLMRIQTDSLFRPQGGKLLRARTLVQQTGQAFVGCGEVFRNRPSRRPVTLVVWWLPAHKEPVLCVSDLAPEQVGAAWYGLRMHIELGFRALKSMGFQWERTRRTDCQRASRHWLVLAVATLLSLAWGTRAEDAGAQGVAPERLRSHTCCAQSAVPAKRRTSVLWQGLGCLLCLAHRPALWRNLWLLPQRLPTLGPDVTLLGPRATLHNHSPPCQPHAQAYVPL